MEFFQIQQSLLHGKTSCVAGQCTVLTDHPMAGNQNPQRIPVGSLSHSPDSFRIADCRGNLTVGPNVTVRNPGKGVPYGFLKRSSLKPKGET